VPHALEFLKIAGFSTDGEMLEMAAPILDVLKEGLDSINAHVISLGGEIKIGTDFDPTKSYKSSTAEF
jgi:hypothetical protein